MPKLPTSLNWLINRRGRIDGSIQKIERYLDKHRRAFEKFQELSNELSFLKETLVSIDTTMRLHKLQIDPQNIPTINGKNYLTDLPRGEITLLIYERVKMGGGESARFLFRTDLLRYSLFICCASSTACHLLQLFLDSVGTIQPLLYIRQYLIRHSWIVQHT